LNIELIGAGYWGLNLARGFFMSYRLGEPQIKKGETMYREKTVPMVAPAYNELSISIVASI